MTPDQLIQTIDNLITLGGNGTKVWQNLRELVDKGNKDVQRDQFQLPLSQADVNQFLSVYTPLYNAAKAAIIAAGNALP